MRMQADSTKQVLRVKDAAPAKGKETAPVLASYDEWTEDQKQPPFWKRCANQSLTSWAKTSDLLVADAKACG
jgi:hypothetical protein